MFSMEPINLFFSIHRCISQKVFSGLDFFGFLKGFCFCVFLDTLDVIEKGKIINLSNFRCMFVGLV